MITFADCSMHNTLKVLGTKYVDYLSSFESNGKTDQWPKEEDI